MPGEPAEAPAPGGKGRKRWLIAAALVAVVLSIGTVILAAGTFEVDRIHFSGLHQVSYDEAYRAAGIRAGDFMGTLDAGDGEQSLQELPWIADARIRRRWPATVEVDVVERTAVALALAAPGSWVLIDIEGRILTSPLVAPPELPRLSGISAAPEASGLPRQRRRGPAWSPRTQRRGQPGFAVVALWRDQRGDVRARVRREPGGLMFEVVLGDESAIGAKTAAIAAVISDLEHSDTILDVSVPHLPVLRGAN